MNTWLLASILGTCVALINLYIYATQDRTINLILTIIWILVAIKNYKNYLSGKDQNSKNNA